MIAFQQAITTTGTAQQLPSNAVVNSVTTFAKSTNAANVSVGVTSGTSATVGYLLEKGTFVVLPIRAGNTNSIWIEGTAADVVSVAGA
jgi:hypothetical protein